jgi:hypothetical protein
LSKGDFPTKGEELDNSTKVLLRSRGFVKSQLWSEAVKIYGTDGLTERGMSIVSIYLLA